MVSNEFAINAAPLTEDFASLSFKPLLLSLPFFVTKIVLPNDPPAPTAITLVAIPTPPVSCFRKT